MKRQAEESGGRRHWEEKRAVGSGTSRRERTKEWGEEDKEQRQTTACMTVTRTRACSHILNVFCMTRDSERNFSVIPN